MFRASLIAQLVKNPPAMQDTWVGKIPWTRKSLPTPVFWPGEFHGLYSQWGHKELDMAERHSLHRRMLFNFHVFVNFPVFLLLIPVLCHCFQRLYLIWFQSFWVCSNLFPVFLESVACVLDKNMYSAVVEQNVLHTYARSILPMCLVARSFLILCNPMDCSLPGSSVYGDSPGKNTRMDCHALL